MNESVFNGIGVIVRNKETKCLHAPTRIENGLYALNLKVTKPRPENPKKVYVAINGKMHSKEFVLKPYIRSGNLNF